eukprot:TRINITY_DN2445_c1_g2_i1.p1 TRINITY_DN2445_c1_g2~~TRINITY_DN2445_c1_g2_i1.p1  ORF type:complete len:763 (+),score=164.14 TRINITY_DN2445_c1_g2_i1:76-2364(+)
MALVHFVNVGARQAQFLGVRACPKHCGELIQGKYWKTHLEEECPYREVLCSMGCGQLVLGGELDDGTHFQTCPLSTFLDRAEVALREFAVKEYRLALEGAYKERTVARARIKAMGGFKDPGAGNWATEAAAKRVHEIETEGHNLFTRARRKAADKLIAVISLASIGVKTGVDDHEPSVPVCDEPGGAMKFWDSLQSYDELTRSARPWDMQAPVLEPLMDVLEEASICGADLELRKKAELLLLAAIRRSLEACLEVKESDSLTLTETMQVARQALRLIELQDPGDIPALIRHTEGELHRAVLRECDHDSPEFHDAVSKGDIDLVRWILDHERANPSIPDQRNGLTPLAMAAKSCDLAMVEILLQRSGEVDGRCATDGMTALHWAAHHRHARMVTALLAGQANPRLQDRRGQDALMKLLRRDFDGAADGCKWSWHTLNATKLEGDELPNLSGVMSLEDARFVAESADECRSFCFYAPDAAGSREFFVTMLTEPPPPPAPPTPPPLEVPKLAEQIEGEEGDDGNEEVDEVERALKELDGQAAAVDVKNEADTVTTTNLDGTIEVDEAGGMGDGSGVASGQEPSRRRSSAKLDSDFECKVVPQNLYPDWVSHLKVQTDPAHDVRILMAAGADPTAKDAQGLTPLHHHLLSAPSGGTSAVVQELLKGGADVNVRDQSHRSTTPFILAVQSRRADLVKMMMTEAWPPADVDTKAPNGSSALAVANSLGARSIANMLRKAGASDWDYAELVLGKNTVFSYDTRTVPPNM